MCRTIVGKIHHEPEWDRPVSSLRPTNRAAVERIQLLCFEEPIHAGINLRSPSQMILGVRVRLQSLFADVQKIAPNRVLPLSRTTVPR